MKNKKAFTLIELLAVIVVLAIIALIATPIVMKTIKNAKKGAAERSADSYIKQVETTVATERLEGNVLEGEYAINSNGNICENKEADCGSSREIEIAVSGNKPKSGTIKIESGQVTLTSTMDIGGCNVTYDSTNKKYVASEKGSTTPDTPTVVYRWSTDTINKGDTMDDSTKYTKDPSTLGKDIYLKHVLDKDNKVTESYVCVIFDSKEYCLKGQETYGYAENENEYTGGALALKKFGDEGLICDFTTIRGTCGDGLVTLNNIEANYDGTVSVNDGISDCHISANGNSICENW